MGFGSKRKLENFILVMFLLNVASATTGEPGTNDTSFINRVSRKVKAGVLSKMESSLGDGRLKLSDVLGSSDSVNGVVLSLNHHYSNVNLEKFSVNPNDANFHEMLLDRDRSRHTDAVRERDLKSTANSSAKFSLLGATYPNGLYYTAITLGTPGQSFFVDIDTGSNLLWVNCQPCEQCTTSIVQQMSVPFDTSRSSTAKAVSCSDSVCVASTGPNATVRVSACTTNPGGAPSSAPCTYQTSYADGSGTLGNLVRDVLGSPKSSASSTSVKIPVVFGCGTYQIGNFYNGATFTYYQGIDGLFGLGTGLYSLSSFLAESYSKLHIPDVFSLCLGNALGEGRMVLGRPYTVPASMVYTPLVKSFVYYRVNLLRISVAGHQLAVPKVNYGEANVGNAIFDSGTTYTIMPPQVQTAIFNSIIRRVGLNPVINNPANDSSLQGLLCFESSASLSVAALTERFPTINIQFEGRGVFMNIRPSVYTFEWNTNVQDLVCARLLTLDIGAKTGGLRYIIGDIWMRDFLIEHDNEKSRIGWAPMECTS